MEKLKIIKGSETRAEEVKNVLESWGAGDADSFQCTYEDYYFYVINGETALIHECNPLLNYIDYEVVELSEPKESEDERIRKAIKEAVEHYWSDNTQARTDVFARLEKQGKKSDYNPYKATVEAISAMVEKYASFDSDLQDFYNNVKIKCKDAMEYDNTWLENQNDTYTKKDVDDAWLKGGRDLQQELEKQGEQKPADKADPKFKVGDWVVSPGGCYLHILDIEKDGYLCEDILGDKMKVLCEHSIRDYNLWTIQDAKDGDVLFMDNGLANCIFIYKSFNNVIINKYASYNKFGFEGEHYLVLNDGYAIPATKQQRDLLFSKMNETGYEWNAEKKELKKIE